MIFKGRPYWDVGRIEFTTGGKLGTASSLPCDDVGGVDLGGADQPGSGKSATRKATSYNVYRVEGLDAGIAIAIAIGDSSGESDLCASPS
ncbi:hypothetical protein GCM10010252_04560 [Streptomyces aureoverticillatus]|nr:hypothetical protein GCM10010252_04560 [Streptomyces aureoverticillatus]